MKKRIVSLFLAALMIAALVPTAAFAADDGGNTAQPRYIVCPACQEGALRNVLITSIEEKTVLHQRLSCGCIEYKTTYRDIHQIQCDNCPYKEETTDSYRDIIWVDSTNCKGNKN